MAKKYVKFHVKIPSGAKKMAKKNFTDRPTLLPHTVDVLCNWYSKMLVVIRWNGALFRKLCVYRVTLGNGGWCLSVGGSFLDLRLTIQSIFNLFVEIFQHYGENVHDWFIMRHRLSGWDFTMSVFPDSACDNTVDSTAWLAETYYFLIWITARVEYNQKDPR